MVNTWYIVRGHSSRLTSLSLFRRKSEQVPLKSYCYHTCRFFFVALFHYRPWSEYFYSMREITQSFPLDWSWWHRNLISTRVCCSPTERESDLIIKCAIKRFIDLNTSTLKRDIYDIFFWHSQCSIVNRLVVHSDSRSDNDRLKTGFSQTACWGPTVLTSLTGWRDKTMYSLLFHRPSSHLGVIPEPYFCSRPIHFDDVLLTFVDWFAIYHRSHSIDDRTRRFLSFQAARFWWSPFRKWTFSQSHFSYASSK